VVQPLPVSTASPASDLDRFNQISGGFRYISGGPFTQPDDIIVDEYYARRTGSPVGDKVDLLNRPGASAASSSPASWRHGHPLCGLLQDLTGNNGKLSQIFLKLRIHRRWTRSLSH